MSKSRQYKLPRFIQIGLVAVILCGGLVVFNTFRPKLVAFDDRVHIERWTGLDLTGTDDPVGYYAKGKDLYSWIRFQIPSDALQAFLNRNGVDEELLREEQHSVQKAKDLTTPQIGKTSVEGWISDGFIPSLAYNGERLSILVGRRSPQDAKWTVYVSKF